MTLKRVKDGLPRKRTLLTVLIFLAIIYLFRSETLNTDSVENTPAILNKFVSRQFSEIAQLQTHNKSNITNNLTFLQESNTEKVQTTSDGTDGQDNVNIVIILAYMHTGSSYTAMIFKQHSGTFYQFEPLRSLQDSCRKHGWIKFLNGSRSSVTGQVVDTALGAEAVANMVTCNHHKLDIKTLSERFPGVTKDDNSDTDPYYKCLRNRSRGAFQKRFPEAQWFGRRSLKSTNLILAKHRPRQLGGLGSVRQTAFSSFLEKDQSRYSFRPFRTNYTKATRKRSLHKAYGNETIHKIRSCLHILQSKCNNSTIRLSKYIRMTMVIGQRLLESFNNLKIIHLLRDPRAMMDSQLRKNDMRVGVFPVFQKRTQYMCKRMLTDFELAKTLKTDYPGRIFTLRYEDLTDNPLKTSKKLYDFVKIPFTYEDTKFVMATSVEPNKNSTYRANVWRRHLTEKHLRVIDKHCNKLYDELGYIKFSSFSDIRQYSVSDHVKDIDRT